MKTQTHEQLVRFRSFVALIVATVSIVPSVASAAGVKLSWDPVTTHVDGTPLTDLGGYKIYYSLTATPPFEGMGATEGASPVDFPVPTLADANDPLVAINNLTSCQRVYFAVTAYDQSGNESAFSEIIDAVMVAKAEDITVGPGASEGSLLVKWTPPVGPGTNNIVGFKVHYDTDGEEPYEGVGAAQGPSPVPAAAGSSSVQLTGLPAGATIFVAVEALCADAGVVSKPVSGEVAAPVCNNNVIENGETCDPPGSCPSSCDDGVVCTRDEMLGDPSQCNASCSVTVIDSCVDGDGCCPLDCDTASDSDCSASCGNGMLEDGEICDPPDTCPASCDDSDACTADWASGNPAFCSGACSHTKITTCTNGDGCCPAGCHALTDNDCEPPPPSAVPTQPGGGFGKGSLSRLVGGCSIQGSDELWVLVALLGGLLLFRRRRSRSKS